MRRSKLSSPASKMSARTSGATPALFTSRSSRRQLLLRKLISLLRSALLAISAWQISARMFFRRLAASGRNTIRRRLLGGGALRGVIDDEVTTELRQFQRDAAADAARRAGDEGQPNSWAPRIVRKRNKRK